ncbi:SUMF1/EgtB/PvdO family nonheme iron enzyme, partial [bacterium]|nr:SUMF1/EgtB/PvdO family nonheme iron enzyme [bacterium]
PKGDYTLSLKKEGYQDWQQTITIDTGRELAVNPVLQQIPKTPSVFTDPVTGMEFVFIQGGCFQMGSPADEKGRDDDETQHEVCVDDFYLAKTEVTNRQYRLYQPRHVPAAYQGITLNEDNQPVVNVSWEDTRDYLKWLNSKQSGSGKFRLPTEAEWEYAARAGTTTSRYWGNDLDQACRFASVSDQSAKRKWNDWAIHDCDDGYLTTAPVGSFKPNAWGLYDMLGNVWEWTADWYGLYDASQKQNPKGPGTGSSRVDRGGSWNSVPGALRCPVRGRVTPSYRGNFLGFRLARTP